MNGRYYYYIGIAVVCFWLLRAGYRFFRKGVDLKKLAAGLFFALLLVFSQDIYSYASYRARCAFQVENKIYDEELYDAFIKDISENGIMEVPSGSGARNPKWRMLKKIGFDNIEGFRSFHQSNWRVYVNKDQTMAFLYHVSYHPDLWVRIGLRISDAKVFFKAKSFVKTRGTMSSVFKKKRKARSSSKETFSDKISLPSSVFKDRWDGRPRCDTDKFGVFSKDIPIAQIVDDAKKLSFSED